jgi:hypothetical protein
VTIFIPQDPENKATLQFLEAEFGMEGKTSPIIRANTVFESQGIVETR